MASFLDSSARRYPSRANEKYRKSVSIPTVNIRRIFIFALESAGVGLVAAVALLLLRPAFLDRHQPVVELHQSAGIGLAGGSGDGDRAGPVSYADAVERAAPAVVNVFTARVITERRSPLLDDPLFRYFFGDSLSANKKRLETSLGSGVIISPQGFVLTNNHVVADADEIQIMLSDGRNAKAEVVGLDPETDLAVLKIELTDLPSVVIGDSEHIRVGDVVFAIGNPFGVGQTVTQGIVSATGRYKLGISTFENFIQTDAAINPGNSGGALINAHGELIGINTAIFSQSGGSQGIGFAIPESLAKDVMKQIIERGRVVRGWLGIEAQNLTPALAESFGLDNTNGVLIAGVVRGGPADQAGINPGDLVLTVDGKAVVDAHEALARISRSTPGTKIEVDGLRKGQPFQAQVEIIQRPTRLRE
jgi:serine protease DegS